MNRNRLLLLVLIIFHAVGLVSMFVPSLRELVLPLSSLNLLLAFIILGFSFKNHIISFLIFSCVAFLYGISVEWIGVHTGLLFGDYSYGRNLGIKFDGIPLIIGINWGMLILCSSSIVSYFKFPLFLEIIVTSLLMTAMDFLIEPVAVQSNYWSWATGEIPLYNYICWFLLSLPLAFIAKKLKLSKQNSLAVGLYLIFVCFFGILNFA